MEKFPKCMEFIKKLTSIYEDQSGSDSDINELCNSEEEFEEVITEIEDSEDSGNENLRNTCYKRRRMRIISDSKSENEMEVVDTCNLENSIERSADGTLWETLKEGGGCGGKPAYSMFKDVSGPTAYAKKNIMLGNVRSSFELIIDNGMIEYFKICTETEARKVLKKDDWSITEVQLRAFISILYARGAYEAKSLKASYLWSKKWGTSFFSKTMSRDKFMEILRFIRFDKRNQRSQRLKTDKFALISLIWDKFIQNSQACYKPGENLTVDEQLFPSKTRCRFTQFMANKPDEFGIKFWLASDVKSKYLINDFPYLGKDEKRPSDLPLGEFVVLKLTEPYLGHGRNITTDNFFKSISLAKKLLKKKKTTLVGTLRANRKELPKFAKAKKDNMIRYSTKLYKSDEYVLTVCKSKPNKKVLLLSSKHKNVKVENDAKRVPETVAYYNKTKFGVDIVDQMARKYSVKTGSRIWPLHVFYNILDLAAINAWILYKETTGVKITHKNFIFQLAEELGSDHRDEQNTSFNSLSVTQNPNVRKSCQIGLRKKNRSNNICIKCNKYVCGKSASKIEFTCKKCIENNCE
ncbi:piggyBac transposable element-derived protein 4-like [Parasteatoda tepidariorum]|uniref:piggyBac transposable element-derived protein 4-like n=1 Tax=Parasteatoda tepidariorum TaxID=114398 RepID=UPI0039BC36AC